MTYPHKTDFETEQAWKDALKDWAKIQFPSTGRYDSMVDEGGHVISERYIDYVDHLNDLRKDRLL